MCERFIGLTELLNKCAETYYNEDIKNIKLNIQDKGNDNNEKIYTMCYNKNIPETKKLCGPCFAFFHWPSTHINSFEDTKNEIIKMSNNEPIIDKVGWIGNIHSAMDGVPDHYTRPLLKKIADENAYLFDVFHNHLYYRVNSPTYLSLPDLVKTYKYLIDIGGNGYSGRLKYLLFSKRPILLVDRNYIEYFHNDLIAYKHYIPVKMDLSDLLEKVEWIRNNYEQSLEIANNAFEFAITNFTMEKILERIYYVYNNVK
jgi:hypothetical protein